MIFDVYRNYWIRSQIKKSLLKKEISCSGNPQSALILYRLDEMPDLASKIKWVEQLRMKEVYFVAFVEKQKDSVPENVVCLSRSSVAIMGGISNPDIQDVLDRPYDVLINYYDRSNRMLDWLSHTATAGCKVSLGNAAQSSSDLLINVPITAITDFIKELNKYLKILAKK
jgi:hypothetical protein